VESPANPSFILTLMSPDAVGIVAAVTTELTKHGGHHGSAPFSETQFIELNSATGL